MKTILFYLTLLFSLSLSIKIKIPTGSTHPSPPMHVSPPLIPPVAPMDPYNLIRSCDSFTPQISGADLLAYYSHDIYNSLQSLNEELVIVRHEIQRLMGYTNHRIVYRMRRISAGGSVFIALKIKVSMTHQVSVLSYIQSSDFSEISTMMGFRNNQMYSYPCGNLQSQCVQAFVRMAAKINVCQGDSYLPNGNPFVNGMGPHRRRRKKHMMHIYNDYNDSELDDLSDSLDHDINANIRINNRKGKLIQIGSSRH